MEIKLHLCCGDIYLEGYENLDIQGTLVDKVTPEELERNKTSLENYFKYPFGTGRRSVIVDGFLNLTLPWDGIEDNTVDEIVMISSIEHFTPAEAKFIISECKRVLVDGGVLKLDFPDIRKVVNDYMIKDPEFCMELIYCNQKNQYSMHKWGYTRTSIYSLLGEGWFLKSVSPQAIVKHDYPMLGAICIKGEV